ncbi:MAG: quinohemoprotein amine dehydrogenase subunit beta [Rhodocyclales bacterium]|nr:quinohemoprotein amine dehydrogenase subunit beta [Rhodocyclales bacterium]
MNPRRFKTTLAAVLLLASTAAVAAADYLLTVTRPNTLHVVDVGARKVLRSISIPGDGIPTGIVLPEDGKTAYVLTNRFESIVGIDLDSGRQVFRADMSEGDLRVKSMFSLAVSRDGRQLYVHQIPTRLKRSEYESLETRIAVYNTADGIGARPVKTFPAPRRISVLAPGAGPDRVVALGWDVYVFDAARGVIDKTFPLRNWQREGIGEPDVLNMWYQYEQTGILSTPYFAPKTDALPGAPDAVKLGIMTFDLAREEMTLAEVGNAESAIFSSVVNPARRHEVFTVMNQIFRIDLAEKKLTQRLDLDQTYYAINISSDGKELYVGGALDKIAVYDTATLARIGEIAMPGGADQSLASMRMVRR